jgi:predicted permease
MNRRGKRPLEDLDQEIREHIELATQENIDRGMAPEEARYAALRKFGNVTRVKEDAREVWTVVWLEQFVQDIRFALRQLRKSPGFAAVAVLTLALGIGANTVVFSLTNALMLRTVPVRNPGMLVELLHRYPGEPAFNGFSWDAYQVLRNQNHVLSDLIVDSTDSLTIRGPMLEPHTVFGGFLSGTFFETLGLRPAIGRLIGSEADDLGHPSAIAVVSWAFWKNNFNLDPAILGKQIIVDDTPVTIVGVAQQGFSGLNEEMSQEVWLPLSMEPVIHDSTLGWGSLGLVGRLKPGVSLEEARAELAVLFQSAIQAPGVSPYVRETKFEMQSAASGLSSPIRQILRTPVIVLMAITSLVLLLACANLASLLLARGASRHQEMAVRVCLGAGRLRLMRQVLTESLLLCLFGSLFGIFLAYFGGRGLLRMITSGRHIVGLPVHAEVLAQPDSHVLLFTGAITLVTALLFGAFPAMGLSSQPASALQQVARIGESRPRRLFGKSLIVAQVAVSTVLLSVAMLFVGYVSHLRNADLGFRRDHLLLVNLDLGHSGYDAAQWSRLSQDLLAQLEALPGVRSATLSGTTPMLGAGASSFAAAKGHPENRRVVSINFVAPHYFETYGTPLLAGRDFSFQDEHGPLVAITNQAVARDYFGSINPIGSYLTLDHITGRGNDTPTYEIVGVVSNAKYNDLQQPAPRTIYLHAFQEDRVVSRLSLHTAMNPEAVTSAVREKVGSVLKMVRIVRVTTMTDQIDASIVPERLTATLSTCFAALAALLASVGLYGLLTYTFSRRTNEIGVRIALGATSSNVMRMVLAEALVMVGAGLLIGAPLAIWTTKVATKLIPHLAVNGPVWILWGVATVLAVTMLAAYLPVRRAARVDPIVALRYE